jgi:hypothetical protein
MSPEIMIVVPADVPAKVLVVISKPKPTLRIDVVRATALRSPRHRPQALHPAPRLTPTRISMPRTALSRTSRSRGNWDVRMRAKVVTLRILLTADAGPSHRAARSDRQWLMASPQHRGGAEMGQPDPVLAAVALSRVEAEVEAFRILRLRSRAADRRMLAQQPVHLAGHVGGEAIDAAVLHLNPFRMGARRADQSVFDACTQSRRLLAAHDVGGTGSGLAEQAGDDLAFAAVLQIHRHRCLGDLSRA